MSPGIEQVPNTTPLASPMGCREGGLKQGFLSVLYSVMNAKSLTVKKLKAVFDKVRTVATKRVALVRRTLTI